jgi:hypothetical protein
MPKGKCSDSSSLIGFVQEFGEKYFSTDGKILFCKVCEISVMAEKRFCVRQHCDTAKHQKNLHLQSMKQNRQKLLLENPETSTSSKTSQFHSDLCEMLISANIPLNKVSNKQSLNFMEKYTNISVPTESTLGKKFLSSCYEDAVRRVRNIIWDNKIWVSIDESTDVDSRCVASVIVGALFADRPGNTFLLDSEVLDKVSHTTIAIPFDSAIKMLWKDEVKRDRILLFVRDAVPYA